MFFLQFYSLMYQILLTLMYSWWWTYLSSHSRWLLKRSTLVILRLSSWLSFFKLLIHSQRLSKRSMLIVLKQSLRLSLLKLLKSRRLERKESWEQCLTLLAEKMINSWRRMRLKWCQMRIVLQKLMSMWMIQCFSVMKSLIFHNKCSQEKIQL